jgi:hypothetical protein
MLVTVTAYTVVAAHHLDPSTIDSGSIARDDAQLPAGSVVGAASRYIPTGLCEQHARSNTNIHLIISNAGGPNCVLLFDNSKTQSVMTGLRGTAQLKRQHAGKLASICSIWSNDFV